MEFEKYGLIFSSFLLLFIKGTTGYDCPSDFPFPSCPRPFIDSHDDTVCCVTDYGVHTCCSGTVLALWAIIVICLALLLILVVFSVILCCICPCCWIAARRNQQRPANLLPPSQIVVNQGSTETPPPYSYQRLPGADPQAYGNSGTMKYT